MYSPEIIKIDHISIAVSDMNNAIGRYNRVLLRKPKCVEFLEDINLQLAFYEIQGVSIELISPTQSQGDIWAFIKEKGEGLHHICFEVNNISGILKKMKELCIELIDDEPRAGSRGSKIAFINSKSANGVLMEYCELPKNINEIT